MSKAAFSEAERAAVYRVIRERRDMRHFCGGEVPAEQLARLLEAAHQAPSVGLMQPWRFVRVTRPALRVAIHQMVDTEREATAVALGERAEDFMRLKVEGILDCAELLVAALPEGRDKHDGSGLGGLRHPEYVAGRPGRGPGSGLGLAV